MWRVIRTVDHLGELTKIAMSRVSTSGGGDAVRFHKTKSTALIKKSYIPSLFKRTCN